MEKLKKRGVIIALVLVLLGGAAGGTAAVISKKNREQNPEESSRIETESKDEQSQEESQPEESQPEESQGGEIGTEMADIVRAAYALEPGGKLEGTQTLTGVVTKIGSAYSEQYGNISVTIVVGDMTDYPITCYRMTGEGIENLAKGDTITVEGTLTNYNGTIEFETGCVMTGIVKGEGGGEEQKLESVEDIINAAYALEENDMMDQKVSLTGRIISIDTPWSDQYGNITVTIEIPGFEDKPIKCYRLQGTGAKDLKVTDLITCTGVIKNYNGTVEFDQGCEVSNIQKGQGTPGLTSTAEILKALQALQPGQSLDREYSLTGKIVTNPSFNDQYGDSNFNIEVDGVKIYCYATKGDEATLKGLAKGDTVTVEGNLSNYNGTLEYNRASLVSVTKGSDTQEENLNGAAEIIGAAYLLEDGDSLSKDYSLTGKITTINTPYSDQYGNITVTIEVPGFENCPIQCYRLKGEGAADLSVGDTITCTGRLKNYMGTIEFDSGCKLSNVVKGEGGDDGGEGQGGEEPVVMTPAEIVAAAYALENNTALEGIQSLRGKIVSIDSPYSEQYGNIIVTIVVEGLEDKPIQCFRMKGEGIDTLAKGDTLTCTGTIKNFNGTIEFDANCQASDIVKAEGGEEPEDVEIIPEATALTDGHNYILVISGSAMTKTMGTKGANATAAELAETGLKLDDAYLVLKAVSAGEGKWYFTTPDGKYMTSGATGSSLSFTDEANDYSLWELLDKSGTTIVNNVNAQYVDAKTGAVKQQALESWNGQIYPYGHNESTTNFSAYAAKFYEVPLNDEGGEGEGGEEGGEGEEPVVLTPAEIVAAAYALENNTALEGTKSLTGKITAIDSPYNEQDGNITVTIVVEGAEDKPIQCFCMKGEGIDTLAVGDTLTCTGILKNFNGTIEFDANCQASDIVKAEGGEEPEDVEIIPEATALTDGHNYILIISGSAMTKTMGTKGANATAAELAETGLKLDDAYLVLKAVSAGEGKWYFTTPDGKYMTSGATGSSLSFTDEANDYSLWELLDKSGTTIVNNVNAQYVDAKTGAVKQQALESWNGQIYPYGHNGSTTNFSAYAAKFYEVPLNGEGGEGGEEGEGEEPVVLTPAEIVAAAYALENNTALEGTQSLTGKITSIDIPYSEQYGNITVTIVVEGLEDKPIQCFRMKGEGIDTLAVGDTLTCTGTLKNYNGTIEFDANCQASDIVKAEGGEEPVEKKLAARVYTLEDKQQVILVVANNAMTNTMGTKGPNGLAAVITEDGLEVEDNYLVLTAVAAEEGKWYFTTPDGKYMTSGATGSSLSFTEEANDYSLWEIVGKDSAVILNNVNAKYVDSKTGAVKQQALESWNGQIYPYGHNESTTNFSAYDIMFFALPDEESGEGGEVEDGGEGGEEGGEAEEPVEPTPAEIVAAAYALEKGKAMEGTQTLTGKVVGIVYAYSEQYENISVNIVIEGAEDMPIQCFRMKGEGVADLAVGDTLTCTGTLKNYNGTIEFDANCLASDIVKAEEDGEAEEPEKLTPAEIVAAAYALEQGKAMVDARTLTGKIVSIDTAYSAQYGNITVTIVIEGVEDKPIQCYRMKGEGVDTLAVGDTLTCTGILKNYNGKIEFDSNCQASNIVKAVAVED